MPTAITRNHLRWLLRGPWGQRIFLVLPNSPLPHEVLARELGIFDSMTEHAVAATLRGRSWNAAQRRWVEDSRSGEDTAPL
jgi:hypothetical protein